MPTQGSKGPRHQARVGPTLWVPDAWLAFLLLFLPLEFGLEVLDLAAQARGDVCVLRDVVGHGLQVTLDLVGPDTRQGQSAQGCPARVRFHCDVFTPETCTFLL